MESIEIDIKLKFNMQKALELAESDDAIKIQEIMNDPELLEKMMLEDVMSLLNEELGPEIEDGLAEVSILGTFIR